MIVQLAGLPGTGTSSLAAELVHQLEGRALLLDKDRVRHALFGLQPPSRQATTWARICGRISG
jgi:predicted kinase